MKILALLALAPFAGAQILHYELEAPAGVTHYGHALAALPDIDGDGRPDLALSAYFQRVELHSGASGALLAARENAVPGYGAVLASAGDANGDGRADLLVGVPGPFFTDEWNPQPTPGFVELLSGADGSLLFRLDEQGGSDAEFGQSLLGLGDVNGDGHADFAVGAPAHVYEAFVDGLNPHGHVHAFSGADGSPLWTAQGALPRAGFGVSLAALPDLDGDGVAELAVGAPCAAADVGTVEPKAEIDLLSGATGVVLRRILQPDWPGSDIAPSTGFAATLAVVPVPGGLPNLLVGRRLSYWPAPFFSGAVLVDLHGQLLGLTDSLSMFDNLIGASVAAGDITGDGSPELLTGHQWGSGLTLFDANLGWRNRLGKYTVATGSALPWMPDSIGTSCAVLGDVTGDGVADFVMGESLTGGDATHSGRVRVFEGGPGPWTNVGGASVGPHQEPQIYPCLTRTPPTAYSPDSGLCILTIAPEKWAPNIGRLVIGFDTLSQPLFGGVLVPAPQFSVNVVNFPEDVPLLLQVPAALPSGLTFWMQLGVVDGHGAVSLSDAWKGELP